MWRRRLRYHILILLRLKGMPRKIALGFALGACINFYPTFGVGVLLAGLVARLFWANITAGILGDIMFKPLFPLFFYLNLKNGGLVMFKPQESLRVLHDLVHLQTTAFLLAGKVFFAGALVNTLILGTVLFLIVYVVFRSSRRKVLLWFWKHGIFRRSKIVSSPVRTL